MAECAVMGAGIMGLGLAFELARRGRRVVVIERDSIGAGASGGLVGALAPHVPEAWNPIKALQLQSLLEAGDFWTEAARIGGFDPGFGRLGRVQPLADEAAVARANDRAAGAREHWGERAMWRVCRAWEVPGLKVRSQTGWVIHDTLTARVSPRRAGTALVAAITALGGEIRRGTTPPGGMPVIWATGVQGLEDLGQALALPMGGPVKGQAALLAADWRDSPQVQAPGLHIVPHADGTVAIGSTSERDFTDPFTTDDRLDAVIARARALCPDLAEAPVLERWAGLRPRSPSRVPVLGSWPGRPGHYVLNGGFTTGFGMAPALARLMADLIVEGHDAIPCECRIEANLPAPRD